MIFQKYQQILGRYRIEGVLGKGGYGEVYLARHMLLNVFRAIKVLHRNMPGITEQIFSHFQRQFHTEAMFGARLENQHIVRVYDYVEENGTLYLIMEYLPSGTLEDFLANHISINNLLPLDNAIRIIREIAIGLAAIHQLYGVHRDLKPTNILLDQQGRTKIADLGIVQLNPLEFKETLIGGHPGTPLYMSPEQRTTSIPLSPASDVYSFGLIAFEILTLKKKFFLPEKTCVSQFRDDIPPWVDDVIEGMLDATPENRPKNGQEVFDLLSTSPKKESVLSKTSNYINIPLPYNLQIQMIKIPSGPFLMGTNDHRFNMSIKSSPMHTVTLAEFWIGRYPITVPQFAAFIRRTGYVTTAERESGGLIYDHNKHEFVKVHGASWISPYGPNTIVNIDPNRPVTMVSWIDAQVFCRWLKTITGINFRLPSEAEWEKAARGTDGRYWSWGNNPPNYSLCNCQLSEQDITPSTKYSPIGDSPFGCCDMMGNIWEWTNSIPFPYPYNPNDGRENILEGFLRVLRGGSIIHTPTTVYRDQDPENDCYFNDGFRVAASSV